jgi:hypothetical protein
MSVELLNRANAGGCAVRKNSSAGASVGITSFAAAIASAALSKLGRNESKIASTPPFFNNDRWNCSTNIRSLRARNSWA